MSLAAPASPLPPTDEVIHVWMPTGRSLCDRPLDHEVPLDEERQTGLPACGACLMLAGFIRRRAAAVLAVTDGVTPELVSDAWQQLAGTTWARHFDLAEMRRRGPSVDRGSTHDLTLAVDPATVTRVVTQWRDGINPGGGPWVGPTTDPGPGRRSTSGPRRSGR